MEIKLRQAQIAKLQLTPQLIQSIDLLQMTTEDLVQYIDQQIEENPFIEKLNQEKTFKAPVSQHDYSTTDIIENTLATDTSDVYTSLLKQLPYVTEDPLEKEILKYMILNIDEQGYLKMTQTEIQEAFPQVSRSLETIRLKLQDFEPTGIGANNAAESLLWQGIKAFPNEMKLHELIKNHLQAVAHQAWEEITEDLNISIEEVLRLKEKLLTLNPRPVSQFQTPTNYVIPDIIVTATENEDFAVQLQDHMLPSLTFNEAYFKDMLVSQEVKQYKHERRRHFKQLSYSLTRRQETLKQVTFEILRRQEAFFISGYIALKPMTMKQLGESLSLHESTISRTIKNKTIQTDKGIFELRTLFSQAMTQSDGEVVSQAMIKEKLKQWIEKENKQRPLSDQKLVEKCQNENINISRRTIAKYRKMMYIPSSSKRKLSN